jgi:hypothetical protein
MTLEEVIVTETAAIASAFPLVAPVDAPAKCIVYQLIGALESQMDGYVGQRVQLGCWARSYGDAVALANTVRSRFWGRHVTVGGVHYRSMVLGMRDGNPDLEAGRFSRLVDVRFDYRNPV